MILVKWKNLALIPQEKAIELPDDSSDIHLEWGGWCSNRDVYLWWRDKFSVRKRKKIVTTQWYSNLNKVKDSLKIIYPSTHEGKQ